MKNLSPMLKEIIAVMELHGVVKPAIAIAFTTEIEDYQVVHWATNISRANGIKLFKETANKMISQTN